METQAQNYSLWSLPGRDSDLNESHLYLTSNRNIYPFDPTHYLVCSVLHMTHHLLTNAFNCRVFPNRAHGAWCAEGGLATARIHATIEMNNCQFFYFPICDERFHCIAC